VSPSALLDANAPLDPGTGTAKDMQFSFSYQPTDAFRTSIDYTKAKLVRDDTRRTAFDADIYTLRATYQFTRFTFARARVDYDSLSSGVRGQYLLGWTPNPGTSLYVGYNDDLNIHGYSPFTGHKEPGFRRNGRTFFIKTSYLFRRSL
jgi:predicted porin